MLPIPRHLQTLTGRDRLRWLAVPAFWILLISILLHAATYPGQVRAEARIAEMKLEFRKWWEYGGKTMLTIQGINPDNPEEYNTRLKDWIGKYTEKHFRYNIHLVPNTAEPHQFFTAWILQPGWLSLALFVWFYLYTSSWLDDRWGKLRNLAVFIASCALGTTLLYMIAGVLFRKYLDTPFTGTSFGLAVSMGALAVTHQKSSIPVSLPGKSRRTYFIPVLLFVAAWFILDSLVNWFANPGLYSAVVPINFLLIPLGVFLGLRIPARNKTVNEIRKEQLQAALERTVDLGETTRTSNRTYLADGFAAATRREFQAATTLLTQGLAGLLRETPPDDVTIDNAVQRMVHPDMLIDVPANQWLEWGNQLSKVGLPGPSILCLERNLSLEHDERFARMALLLDGAQRVKYSIDPDKGRAILKKVIDIKSDDLHAKRAADMLAKYPAVSQGQ